VTPAFGDADRTASPNDAATGEGTNPLDDRWTGINALGMRYALANPDNLVFSIETGETHLLSDLPTLLLQLLQSGARSGQEVCEQAALACATAVDDGWRSKVLRVLESLEELELIERRPASSA
jgi:hypothetical protein